ncbi:MAG TPA: ferritin-like domain-containing protein [Bryobacteraceae bacterium]|nr:ferritin-like domain-containing protein [Bryobacteraceae bacterium]
MEPAKSIRLLNTAVADELQAVHQYMYFHFHLDDQGFKPLAQLFKKVAIQEMAHVEALAERVLFLKGDVEMTPGGPIQKILEPESMLVKAMAMEQESARAYNQAALDSGADADSSTKHLFEELVRDEEGHFDQFEKQHDNIKRFGLSYLALQSFGGGEVRAPAAGE